jgi:hypothetical protein
MVNSATRHGQALDDVAEAEEPGDPVLVGLVLVVDVVAAVRRDQPA